MKSYRPLFALAALALVAAGPAAGQDQTPRQIGVGETLRGELAAGDAAMPDGSYYDAFVFRAVAGQSYAVTLSSEEFDTFLHVNGPGGLATENDDADEGATHSKLEFTAPESGEVRICANSLTRRETGRYSVSLQAGVAQRRIAVAEDVTGDLTASSPKQRDGTPFQAFVFEGRAGQAITVDMKSRDFDSFLTLRRAGGSDDLITDDDAGGGADAQIFFTLPAAGTYEIRANSISPTARGRFSLKLSDGVAERKAVPVAIDYGRIVRGELKTGGGRDTAGLFYDSFSFTGRRGDRVTLSAVSGEFDPVLFLGLADRTKDDEWIESNDDEVLSDTGSLIQTILPRDGAYEVRVVSYNPGEAGRYVLGLGLTR